MGGVSLHGVASATNIESASWASTSSAANSSYYIEMSPSPPRVRGDAYVAASMAEVSIHIVASATNIEGASWAYTSSALNASYDIKIVTVASLSRPCCLRRHINGRSESPRRGERHQRRVRELSSTSSAANVSYYIEMSPSPPRVRGDAYVAASMAEVSIHIVASATNIEGASWAYTSSALNASYDIKIVTVASLSRPCCLRRHINGRSESPRRGERHQRRVRELGFHQQRRKCAVPLQNCHRRLPVSTVLLASPHQWAE
ncbi:hypothetical protein PF003_g41017 [Phytophthora fragariae]|nr:hypothetical protein PF003_g41017 [Phytophthora fragariae]